MAYPSTSKCNVRGMSLCLELLALLLHLLLASIVDGAVKGIAKVGRVDVACVETKNPVHGELRGATPKAKLGP